MHIMPQLLLYLEMQKKKKYADNKKIAKSQVLCLHKNYKIDDSS